MIRAVLDYGPVYLAGALMVMFIVGFVGWWLDEHRPLPTPWDDES